MNLLDQLRRWLSPPSDETIAILSAAEGLSDPSRRRFLKSALLASAVAATVDVDQLLWMPGERSIVIPEFTEFATYSGNTFITPLWVTQEVARIWENELSFVRNFSREYR